MFIKILATSLMVVAHLGSVNAFDGSISLRSLTQDYVAPFRLTPASQKDLFQFPEKTALLNFLDSQFDGNLFPGKFNFQDRPFLDLVDSYSGRYVNQPAVAYFVKYLEPYYRKNFEARMEEFPSKNPNGIDHAIALKQNGLYKYFYDNLKVSTSEKYAYQYFTIALILMKRTSLEHLRVLSYKNSAKF